MKSHPFSLIVILAIAGAGPGCTSYRFNVDAVSMQPGAGEAVSYVVVNANPEIDEADLRYIEAVDFLETALSAKGMFPAPEGVEPDIMIEFDFGMEPRRDELRAFSRPGSMAVVATPAQPAGVGGAREHQRDMRTIVPMADALGDERFRVVRVTSYPKYLRITAREVPDIAGDQVQREVWSVFVSNENGDDDLRKYVPLMVSAAMDSLSVQTSPDHVVVLGAEDGRVAFVKSVE